MTYLFVSHSSEDNYFVGFLIELLKFHRVKFWVDQSNLIAGGVFTSDIENALAACDSMLVVVSKNSSKSRWITREVSAFRAIKPDRPIIPFVLDAEADPNEIYEGLGLFTQLRCYESLLESFRELLRLSGRVLFPVVENRKEPDRRSLDRRQQFADRRRNPIERRLRVGMDKYIRGTGRDLLTPLSRAREVGALARLLAADDSPLQSFDFVDRRTGEQVQLDFRMIESMAFKSWYSRTEQELTPSEAGRESWGLGIERTSSYSVAEDDMTGAAYIIDDIVNELTDAYIVTSKTRRSQERRNASRRKDDDQSL
jgi:TIR domain